MIVTVADLLKEIIEKEKEAIKEFDYIKHGPTIGSMYEGLTHKVLEKSIFEGLDLRVTKGFIINREGKISNQIDCMIVEGEGKRLPNTNDYVYEDSNVIAVLEIKKTLYKNEIEDSFQKLQRVFEISDLETVNLSLMSNAYSSMTGKGLPSLSEVDKLSPFLKLLYYTLLIEAAIPLRIAIGYYGYQTEYKLRESFISFLSSEVPQEIGEIIRGFSPSNLPNLIISNGHSLLKLNGMPYVGGIFEEEWIFYASSNHNPLIILLEMLWTKLSYKYNLPPQIFGEDLDLEGVHPLISGEVAEINGRYAWIYNFHNFGEERLSKEPIVRDWEPSEIDETEFNVINWLGIEGELDVFEEVGFLSWLEKQGYTLQQLVNSLSSKGLAWLDDTKIRFLTEECAIVAVNGKWYAAENKTGRLSRWAEKQKNAEE